MARKASGLGKDFYSILEDNDILEEKAKDGTVSTVKISDIEPRSTQPRKNFDEGALSSLADSIAEHGVIQPIVIKENGLLSGSYEIIAGERRWRAAKMAGLSEIPAVIIDGDDLKVAEVALIENLQRQDLNPVEEALAYRSLIDRFGLTQEQVAKQVGKNRSTVTNMLRLLDLPEEVLALLKEDKLSTGHARALLPLDTDEDKILLANKVIEHEYSVRDVEKAVKLILDKKANVAMVADPEEEKFKTYMRSVETKAMKQLGRRVRIVRSNRKHVLELAYENNEDLEDLLKRLCGSDFFESFK